MAGAKRVSAADQGKKKKRISKAEKETKRNEESEDEVEEQSGKEKAEKTPSGKRTSIRPNTGVSSSTNDLDALKDLKEKFNALHELRFTAPEKQCLELKELLEKRKTASDTLITRLETRITDLEEQNQTIKEAKKREKELLEQLSAANGELDKLRKSLELADEERMNLTKALESAGEAEQHVAATERLVKILDTFKTITGVTLKLEESDLSKGTCTVYNTSTKKGVKMSLIIGGDSFTFAPIANKQYLPSDLRDTVKVPREEAPKLLARVSEALFL